MKDIEKLDVLSRVEWVSLLSSIGVLLTALVALATLLELKRQRKASYRPEIGLSTERYILVINELDKGLFNIVWRDSENIEDSHPFLNIVNIGLGLAKNIKISWDYDVEKHIEIINKLKKDIELDIDVYIEDGLLKIKGKEKQYFISLDEADSELGYIVNNKDGNGGRQLFIPHIIMKVLPLLTWVYQKTYKEDIIFNSKLDSIEIRIDYKDIGGGRHQYKYDLKINICQYSVENNLSCVEVGIEFEPINKTSSFVNKIFK